LSYRIRKLEDGGIIAGYRYLFDPFGKTIEYFHAKVSLGGTSAGARKTVYNFCARHPNVPFFAETVGEFDFLVCVAVKHSSEALPVLRALHEALAPYHLIIECYTSPTLRKLVKYPFN
jgi:DNA-binding Lrp family transcriptional regulator